MAAERNLSSGLLLRRAECNAGRVYAQARQGDCRDEPDPEVEGRGQRRSDAHQQEWSAWDASDAAHPVVTSAEEPLRPELAGADAGRWVVRALGVPVPDACRREHLPGLLERPDAAAELYTRDAVQSAEQSCAAPALSEPKALQQQPGAAQRAELVVQQKQSL